MKENETQNSQPQEQQDAAVLFWQEVKYNEEKTESER